MQGELLHTDMVEQLSALNALLLERVSSSLLSHAAAARVGQCFAQTPPDAIQNGSDGGSTMLPATLEGCSRAVVPALLLQALSRSFDRYTGCVLIAAYCIFTPGKEATGEIPRAQSCIAYKTSTLTRN